MSLSAKNNKVSLPNDSTQSLPLKSPHNLSLLSDEQVQSLLWEYSDPFSILGMHSTPQGILIRTLQPHATQVFLIKTTDDTSIEIPKVHPAGIFEIVLKGQKEFFNYQLKIHTNPTHFYQEKDPYQFLPVMGEMDQYLFGQGTHYEIYNKMGANFVQHQGIWGVHFAVWAPNAKKVNLIGQFNTWDALRHPMRPLGSSGIWEIFIPDLPQGELYKYSISTPYGQKLEKIDPYAKYAEKRPNVASITWGMHNYHWNDSEWMNTQNALDSYHKPFNIYEVHLGAWKKGKEGEFIDYKTLAEKLIPHLKDLNFTHIELMPVAEHPYDPSWGYQVTGYYAPTARYGNPDELRIFIDLCHQNGIGVILDWVPAHFPKDAHALGWFDGSALYEHADPQQGEHPHWGTYIFNYGRKEVSNFLVANALYWLKEFHIDGLRVDAVASMLYLDYGRNHGEWIPSEWGDNINHQALQFMKHMTSLVRSQCPHAILIAEESTSFAGISHDLEHNGVGFHYKWNMGWMNDFLTYMSKEPVHRKYHHHELIFSIHYAFSENFILVLSHDEIVHGKKSLLNKMPGDMWQKYANLRSLMAFTYVHPGKKLLFMGTELSSLQEWNSNESLPWHLLQLRENAQFYNFLKDLGQLYHNSPSLWELDHDQAGFEWIDCNNSEESTVALIRKDKNGFPVVAICNFTPVVRKAVRFGVPQGGFWKEILNTDSEIYGGSNVGNSGGVMAEALPHHYREYSIVVDIPPLGILFFQPEKI